MLRTMTGAEFIRRIRRLGRARNVPVRVETRKGKGSHARLWYGDRPTVVPHPQRELKRGTLAAIVRQLGLRPDDLK